jgi:flavodoxin
MCDYYWNEIYSIILLYHNIRILVMKALIVYFSQTGNTKQIAESIHEEISRHAEADIASVSRVDPGPCHSSDLAPPVKGFLERLPMSPDFKLAGFFTHSTYMPDNGGQGTKLYDRWAGRCHLTFEEVSKEKNVEFLGYFNCRGKANPDIEAFIKQEIITDEVEWDKYMPELRGHPDTNDIKNAKNFALEILGKL